jgi:membrane protease subunit (stomatin/prohibitin family)
MSAAKKYDQSLLFKGIYEFEDPSGALLAAKVPSIGTVDLFAGTVVLVKPSQTALFLYQGKIADVLPAGSHRIQTENVPILSRLANWRFGFESPLRCELVFVSRHAFTGRRWGTPHPVIINVRGFGSVPMRSFGNFSVRVIDPKKVLSQPRRQPLGLHGWRSRGAGAKPDRGAAPRGALIESIV